MRVTSLALLHTPLGAGVHLIQLFVRHCRAPLALHIIYQMQRCSAIYKPHLQNSHPGWLAPQVRPDTTATSGRALHIRTEETQVSSSVAQWDISKTSTPEKQATYLIT